MRDESRWRCGEGRGGALEEDRKESGGGKEKEREEKERVEERENKLRRRGR